jgi:NAD(P)H-hydrate epimerase
MLHLTRSQLREIDRRAAVDYHIPGIVLMENAARAVADEACRMLRGECCGMILILVGGGNNGGDGLAVARHLHNSGVDIRIALCCDPASYRGDALINWQIVSAMQIAAAPFDPFESIAKTVNDSGLPVLAVDLPSGLDCDTGVPPGVCIRASSTVTFVAEKVGFTHAEARRFLGHVVVGDIGCPIELVERVASMAALPG